MRLYLIRFVISVLITSFTLSIALGCGGRQRRQIKSLESRIDSLEKNMGTMKKNMGTMKTVIERVDSIDKRVTILEQRTYDMEKLPQGKEKPGTIETETDSLREEQ